nr:MAG TPA: hypothetical protein [Caudoviricetes sp.]
MALSWGAAAVTRQHQRAMRPLAAAIGEAAEEDVPLLAGGGRAAETAFMEAALRRQSAAAAVVDGETAGYLGRYGSATGLHIVQDLTGAAMEAREVKMLTLSGPVTRRVAIRQGASEEEALALARRRVRTGASKAAYDRDRLSVIRSARKSRLRARRVIVGKTCAFCSMLAARGPVYTPETAAFQAHPHCDCTYEISDQTPKAWRDGRATPHEEEICDAYDRAAASVPANLSGKERRREIMMAMRRQEPNLFTDGVVG